MCVILDIKPGATVPTSMLRTACSINNHGFGLAYSEEGVLKIIRSLAPNDPAVVERHLAGAQGFRRFLHLRHATVGKVSLDNNHPLVVLSGKKDAVQLAMMHNGTLFDYTVTGSDYSDTYELNQRLISPLAQRVAAFHAKKAERSVLDDPILQHVIASLGKLSLFLLFDAAGNTFRTGEWEAYEGFVASNKYSFSENHSRNSTGRSRSVTTYRGNHHYPAQGRSGVGQNNLPWLPLAKPDRQLATSLAAWADSPGTAPSAKDTDTRSQISPATTPSDDTVIRVALANTFSAQSIKAAPYASPRSSLLKELLGVRRFLSEHKYPEDHMSIIRNLKVYRTNIMDLLKQPDFGFLARLTIEDIGELVRRYPVVMEQVVVELVRENNKLHGDNSRQSSLLRGQPTEK